MTATDEPDFFDLPSADDDAYWERFRAAGLHQPEPAENGSSPTGYTWVDLTDPAYAIPPDPPTIEGILYAGRRHVISGPPESTKTLVAYLLLLQALRSGQGVAILDFEMGPHAAVTLLRELGATEEEIANVHYTEPDGPPTAADIARLVGLGVGFVLLDAAAGAYDTTGLDDNSRKDAETFAGAWIRPLWQNGIATIVIDHVTKNADTRGKFTIGSERKTGQADVHLSLDALKALHRGGTGMVKISVMKDRPGHLPRPTLRMLDIESNPDTHALTWTFRDPHPVDDAGEFRPTIYMEKVSRELQRHPNPMSRNELEEAVKGKRQYIRDAIEWLVREGHITEETGPRNARIYTHQTPYNKPPDDLAPTSPPPRPGEVPMTSPHLAPPRPPLTGGEGEVGGHGSAAGEDDLAPPRIDVTDPAIQHLLDDPEF